MAVDVHFLTKWKPHAAETQIRIPSTIRDLRPQLPDTAQLYLVWSDGERGGYMAGADTGFMKGGGHHILNAAGGSVSWEVCSADQSARSAENFFAFIFHFSGWALVAPSRFALQVTDVRGLQVPGLP